MRSSCASGNHSAEQRPRPGVGSGVRLSALVPLPSPGVPAGLGPEKWSLYFAFLPRLASRLSLLLTPSSTPTPDAPSPWSSLCPGRKGLGHPQAQLPAPPSPASAAMRQLRQRLAGRRVLAQGRCGRPLRRRPLMVARRSVPHRGLQCHRPRKRRHRAGFRVLACHPCVFGEAYAPIFCPFFTELFVFSLLRCESFSIFWMQVLFQIYTSQISSASLWLKSVWGR